ncbi:MAG: hypothetical protein HZY75_01755 [Nocardioidaceae bacterium]|nr:MAG: hypothetical protein HZY75_01755 [Nocardioidaceae bacterium]
MTTDNSVSSKYDKEDREIRCTRNLFNLLEKRTELRGVYGPADQLAETLRWSA